MRRTLLPVIAAALVLAGCSSSDSAGDSAPSKRPALSYVALGDSYTAGPQVAPTDGHSEACMRSTLNYPRLVAKAVEARLTDVSCSGATTANVLEATPIPGTTAPIPAQIDAVHGSTQLVTVGIGGNDSGLFSSLSSACTQQGTACADYLDDTMPSVLRSTKRHVVTVLERIHAKAPEAQVVLVGYLGVTPHGKGCEALGGSALDTRGVSAGEVAIDRMMASAAKAGHATYVSMNAVSAGHDACAGADAWTNGLVPALGDGASLHPRKIGMEAIAAEVEKVVKVQKP